MNKKNKIIILIITTLVLVIIGILIKNKTSILKENKIEILDATYNCDKQEEVIFEDKKYIYYFDCIKSNSVYVKLKDGRKILIKNVLDEEILTIDELIDAGLKINKKEK